ncbi:MAG: flagellar motor switch protein FliG [Christensenellales bacterium]|jgi:flagellar motor switch protein FliG
MAEASGLKGREKAAHLLISLGKETASKIMRHLSEEEIRTITFEIVNSQAVDAQDRAAILDEFYHICVAQEHFTSGGIDYAANLLNDVMGPQRSMEIISDLVSLNKYKPFEFMRKVDPAEVFNYIQHEGDQTIAFILSYLRPQQSAMVLSMLPQERQAAIAVKIAMIDKIPPDIIEEIEKVMERKFMSSASASFTKTEGVDVLVDILNSVERSTEKLIFEVLSEQDEKLAEEVRKRMFVFEDIATLGSREIQRFLTEVDTGELAVALKVATEELKQLILSNMSKRAGDVLREEMDLMGPVRLSEVEKAQQSIVNIIRRLDEKGEIMIRKSGEDEIIE